MSSAVLTQISPSRGAITITADGSEDEVEISNADLVAAFAAPTPLGELVRKPVIDKPGAAALLLFNGKINLAGQIDGVISIAPSISPDWDLLAGASKLVIQTGPVALGSAIFIFYIEFIHTIVR